jgi:hypothetical protein
MSHAKTQRGPTGAGIEPMSHAKAQRRKEDRQGRQIVWCSLFCLFSWYSLCELSVLSGAGVRIGLVGG